MLLNRKAPRRGAVLVESALVYPVVFMILFGIIMLGLAVFRYQQVAFISREASRYASVRGALYASETGNSAATADDVYNKSIKVNAAGMNTSAITYSVTWNTDNKQYHTTTKTDAATGELQSVYITNYVTVTVTYTWNTGIFGSIPVSSTSSVPVSY